LDPGIFLSPWSLWPSIWKDRPLRVFPIVAQIANELRRLHKAHGKSRWRQLKGIGNVKLADGTICVAETNWYEAHGIARKEFKIKRILEEAGG